VGRPSQQADPDSVRVGLFGVNMPNAEDGRRITEARPGPGAEHGSRIIVTLERAWAGIRDRHPEIPDAVIVTGPGGNQKGIAEGYRLRGHHWPSRWVVGGAEDSQRAPELYLAGQVLARGGRAVLEVLLHEASHALAVVRGIKDTSRDGNRYHNKRFARLATELGLRAPQEPDKNSGWSGCTFTDETGAAYPGLAEAIDHARLPFLPEPTELAPPGGDGQDKPSKRGGRRILIECACHPKPRRFHLTPKGLEEGPIVCGNCWIPFEPATAGPDSREGVA